MFLLFTLSRTVKLLIISVISSLPFALIQVRAIDVEVLFLISFAVFLLLTVRDAYVFPFDFWEEVGIVRGVLLPYICLFGLSLICFSTCSSFIFNFLFLPLRFAENFELKTVTSMISVFAFVLIVALAVSSFGYRAAKKEFYENLYYDEEETLQTREDNFTSED